MPGFDFPNTPTTNQIVTGPGGQLYQWNGSAWTIAPVSVAFAPIASPAFTGNPTAPTPSPGDSDTSLATTAFVAAAVGATAYAPLASPAFTGNPTAPTPTAGDADTSIATTAFVAASTATALHDTGRNLVHNPLFIIAHRGAGPFTANGYTLDRWVAQINLDTISVSQQVLSDANRAQIGDEAARFCLSNSFTGNASGYTAITHRIEDVRRLAGKTVTVSFWATAGAAGLKLGVNIAQQFGSGGSPSGQVFVNGQSVALTTAFARYSFTFTLPSVSGMTFGTNNNDVTALNLWYSAAAAQNSQTGTVGVQSGLIWLWGVQLEVGPTATPLEKPDPADDLRRCQRFYCTGLFGCQGYGAAGGGIGATQSFPVTMRATPTVALSGQAYTNASGATVYNTTAAGAQFNAVTTSTAGVAWSTNFTASADL